MKLKKTFENVLNVIIIIGIFAFGNVSTITNLSLFLFEVFVLFIAIFMKVKFGRGFEND